jgi:hypothetical protein
MTYEGLCQGQEARSFALRAAMSPRPAVARSRQGRPSLPMYGWFTEGFDTLDLNQGVLLDELG